jgi:UDP-glucuronate decarboxylase
LKGEPITIYGDGTQTRSFCHVSDLVEGILRFMRKPDDVTGPINLGNPAEITIGELAETVIDLTGSKSRIVMHPLPADDPRRRRPDITMARSLIGWEPVIGLTDGLRDTIAYFRKLMTESSASVDRPRLTAAHHARLVAPSAPGTEPDATLVSGSGLWWHGRSAD